jgi:hypothetical protein
MTVGLDRKLRSAFCLPGHHTPGTRLQCAAAEIRRMGRPVRFASARPRSHVPNHAIPVVASFSGAEEHRELSKIRSAAEA